MPPAIRARGLTKFYGQAVGVAWLDLDVHRGEVFGLVGPARSGKTTTMRLVLDMIRPSGGEVEVLGLDPARDGVELRQRVGFVPAGPAHDEDMTALAYLRHIGGLRGEFEEARALDLAERLELAIATRVRDLSSADQQKVGVVQAFMHDPELLLLDEPTNALDPAARDVLNTLVREARGDGRTVVYASGALSEVEPVADRVGMLHHGRLVQVIDVGDRTSHNITRIEVRFAYPVDPSDFADLAGVRDVEVTGNQARFVVEGSVNALMKAVAAHEVLDVAASEAEPGDRFRTTFGGGPP